jgi:hypothetical protein
MMIAIASGFAAPQERCSPPFHPVAISSQSLAAAVGAAPASIRAREHGVKPNSVAIRAINTAWRFTIGKYGFCNGNPCVGLLMSNSVCAIATDALRCVSAATINPAQHRLVDPL